MDGYLGRILTVNLSEGTFGELPLDPVDLRATLGGAGLAARLLYDRLIPDLDPLHPATPLLFLNGPLSGLKGPAQGRYVVCARSPATGLWGESNCGGYVGPEIRYAGYDGLLFTGRAPQPVYLWLHDGRSQLRDARALWGQADTTRTQARIKAELGQPLAKVACIGRAGERQLPFAVILGDHGRVAGRTGMGAVMGAKNLKAVAVRGTGSIPVARAAAFHSLRSAANQALRGEAVSAVLRQTGSAGASDYFDFLGEMPKRYFTRGVFEGAEWVSGSTLNETLLDGVSTCHGCVIACGRVVTIPDGPFAQVKGKGPEYETIVGFGPNLLNDDLRWITHLGQLCDREGLDTISMSNVIGLAYLLYSQGLLSRETAGAELRWGDPRGAETLIRLTAAGEGLGALLGQGSRALARAFGVEDWAVQVNGLEVAYHDPRGASGMALVYATSPRGACHNQSDYFLVDIGASEESIGVTMHDRHAGAEKAASVARHQDYRTLCNSLVQCLFASVPVETTLELTNAATGFDYSLAELMAVGERAWTLKRLINGRLGLTRANDTLPRALLRPSPDGGSAGYAPPLEEMLPAYYAVRGWDPASGMPLPATLARLGLEELAPDRGNRGLAGPGPAAGLRDRAA